MVFQKLLALIVVLLFFSCNDSKKGIPLLKDNEVGIDFNSVDTYPKFSACADCLTKKEQQNCFESNMSSNMKKMLMKIPFFTKVTLTDTLWLQIQIDKKGAFSLYAMQEHKHITQSLPKIDSLIVKGLQEFPNIEPALKRGIPVNFQCTLPVIIHSSPD